MSTYVTAKLTNPSSALNSFTCMVDLSTLPTGWWDAVDTTDGTKGRVFLAASDIECAYDWINFNSTAKTGLLRFLWYGTLASTGDQYVKVFPPISTNDSYAASDTYGRYNAYDSYWQCYLPGYDTLDRTVNARTFTATGTPYSTTGKLGTAWHFDQYYEYLDCTGVSFSYPVTLMSWCKTGSAAHNQAALSLGNDGSDYSNIQIIYAGDTANDPVASFNQTNVVAQAAISPGPSTGVWFHLAGRFTSTTYRDILLNAGGKQTNTNSANQPTMNRIRVGERAKTNLGLGWYNGDLCEIQVHSTNRSDAWVTEEYNQVNDNTSFWGTWTFESGEDTTSTGSGSINSISNIEGVGNTPPNTGYGNINTISNIEGSGYV